MSENPSQLIDTIVSRVMAYDNALRASHRLEKLGYEVHLCNSNKVEAPLRRVIEGAAIACVDDRYSNLMEPRYTHGPSFPGALDGIAALLHHREGFFDGNQVVSAESYSNARHFIQMTGFQPLVHGDDHNGEQGCKYAQVLYSGEVSHWPTPKDISINDRVRLAEGNYVALEGRHIAQALSLNFRDGTTVVPDGTVYNADMWYLKKLRSAGARAINTSEALRMVIDTFGAVQPGNRRLQLLW